MLANSGPVGQAVSTAWQFAKDIQEMTSLKSGQEGLKKEVTRIMDMLDRAVGQYQAKLSNNRERIEAINTISTGITRYWTGYCRNFDKVKSKPAAAVRKISANTSAARRNKIATGRSVFIFLTSSLTIDGNPTTLLSAPILYDGPLGDPMVSVKEGYLKQIGEQIHVKEENWEDGLRSGNYQAITVHYAKPYSTSFLKSESDCFSAIEGYVAMMHRALDGLTYSENLKFVQLK
jgi:hypothetical protein